MAFIDEITIHARAGNGGTGVERWRHEKGKEWGGPSGGDGGKGGDVYIRAVRDIGILARYKMVKEFPAENGKDGMRDMMRGKDGQDLTVDLPIGSVIKNLNTGFEYELNIDGEEIRILQGGKGGFGNAHFKSSTNTSPKEWTPGAPGDEADFFIEVRLIVDAGFVGFPNAGKSSLLNAITNAKAKVASYAFTTLEPNLGDFFGFILADIPGLIEGASEGKGLGYKFLRHIRRTKMIFHCISLEQEKIEESYRTIRAELEAYSHDLAIKPEVIVLTKTDTTTPDEIKKAVKTLKKIAPDALDILPVSILNDEELKVFQDSLVKLLRKG
jgi:GTP-binding protein